MAYSQINADQSGSKQIKVIFFEIIGNYRLFSRILTCHQTAAKGSAADVSLRLEPIDGIGEGLSRRRLGQAQFADGFGGIEEHFVFSHTDAGKGSFGRFAGKPGYCLIHARGNPCHAIGNPHLWRVHSRQVLKHTERLFHRPVSFSVAQNISFADAAFFGCEDVADGDIANMDPIQTGVEVGGHFAIQKIDDDLAGRRWFDVARSNGRARIDDHNRNAFGGKISRDLFGAPFRDFVMIRKLAFCDCSGFVGWRGELTACVLRQTDAADCAGIDNACATRLRGGFKDVSSAIDVGGVHWRVILEPKMVTRRHMKTPIASAQTCGDRRRIGDVAIHALEIDAGQTANIGRGPQERLDTMAVRSQFLDKVGSDKTRRAGDKTIHAAPPVNHYRPSGITKKCKLDLDSPLFNYAWRCMPLKNCDRKKLSRDEQKELDVKIGFMEGVVRRDPAFVEALQILGDDYTRRGKYVAGLKIDEQLSQLRPGDPSVLYNLACSYSLTGNFNRAIAALEQALNLGFDDFKWMARDPDLVDLRQHPLYKSIRAKIRKMKAGKT
jgi:hypothetical protein